MEFWFFAVGCLIGFCLGGISGITHVRYLMDRALGAYERSVANNRQAMLERDLAERALRRALDLVDRGSVPLRGSSGG